MTDDDFDKALIRSAFDLAAARGWDEVTVVEAARRADLPLDQARARFPARPVILMRFGRMADMAALAMAHDESLAGSPARDRLFDVVMRRIDVFQAHRDGVLALFRALPRHPATTLLLGGATIGSMAWLLEAAGIPVTGLRGMLRVHGMAAVWAYTLRAWEKDDSEDMSATLAALDRALDRAEQAEATLYRDRRDAPQSFQSTETGQTTSMPAPEPFEPPSEVDPDLPS